VNLFICPPKINFEGKRMSIFYFLLAFPNTGDISVSKNTLSVKYHCFSLALESFTSAQSKSYFVDDDVKDLVGV